MMSDVSKEPVSFIFTGYAYPKAQFASYKAGRFRWPCVDPNPRSFPEGTAGYIYFNLLEPEFYI